MDFYQFYQLFRRHLLLLILVPFVLALTVYLFTRKQSKTYSSEAIIYSGIATGYSIETMESAYLDYYGTNVQFDNLINLFFSRQTIEQTAIKLLAQDLCLEQYNPQYISKQHFDELQALVSKEVKNLVVKHGKMGLEREREEQILKLEEEIQSLEQEITRKKDYAKQAIEGNEPVNTEQYYQQKKETTSDAEQYEKPIFHRVSSGESIYSIASMYGLSVGELIEINNLSTNRVEPGQILIVEKADIATKNQYHIVEPGETLYSIARKNDVSISKLRQLNNLKTDKLKVGQRLIVSRVIPVDNSSTDYSNETSSYYDQSQQKSLKTTKQRRELFQVPRMNQSQPPKDPIIPPGVIPEDYYATVDNFNEYYRSSDTNFIYELLHYAHKHYSIRAITLNSNINRVKNSDLIKITYQSDDPGICQQTLKILAQVFIRNYKLLRVNQTDAVVNYFQEQVDSANAKLQRAEDRLLQFNKRNNIINYYEQSKYIAAQKEDLDLYVQNEQIRLASAAAALNELETKLASKDSIYLASDEIQKVRQKLSEVEEKIFINELDAENDPRIGNKLEELKLVAKQYRNQLKYLVDKYYMYSHSPEGIPIKELLTEWLDNVLAFEESKAAMRVLRQRKDEFRAVYQVMAPLGAMLKRIEREIDVAEESYLELLRNLNMAKMKQQNIEMATNIKIVDEPFFPIAPNPSRAKLLVIVAAVIGFILVAFLILMLEFFDTSVKSSDRVQKVTKLKLAGAYPKYGSGAQSQEFKDASERLLEIMIQNIKLAIGHHSLYTSEKPYFILIFSTQPGTGKTTIATNLIRKLRSYGEKVLYLNYTREDKSKIDDDYNYTIQYKIDNKFVEIKHLKDLLKNNYIRQENYTYDYIFLEIPSIIFNSFPLDLIETVDFSLIVIRAKDYWKKADMTALNTMLEVSREKPMIILNQAEVYALEDILHSVPKHKPSIRKKIKKILMYPFKFRIRVKVD